MKNLGGGGGGLIKTFLFDSGHVGHAPRVHVVHILEGGALVGRDHVHEGARSLGPPQHESESFSALVQNTLSRKT